MGYQGYNTCSQPYVACLMEHMSPQYSNGVIFINLYDPVHEAGVQTVPITNTHLDAGTKVERGGMAQGHKDLSGGVEI